MAILQNKVFRSIVYQLIFVLIIAAVVFYAGSNLTSNLQQRNITTGFEFLHREAGFDIGESPIPYNASDTYTRALIVGVLNTVIVSFVSVIFATLLGLIVGICLLSPNWLLRQFCYGYVNLIRNTPLILQLFMWYALLTQGLPESADAFKILPNVFLSNRGLDLPKVVYNPSYTWVLISLLVGVAVIWLLRLWAKNLHKKTGKIFSVWPIALVILVGCVLIPWGLASFPLAVEVPQFTGFSHEGGSHVSPEFFALWLGLVVYSATFIAETVRAGIVSVSKGQTEAGLALGLKRSQVLRMIVLPQALRVIIPPFINQVLNITKNSTLAIAIGYPDFVSIANTTLNQTGQAIEAIALVMLLYLSLSLISSLLLNLFNAKVRLKTR